jgi:Protein of unknown function (DUF4058)
MPCPFPGMDPYLESPPFWSDFAPKFLTAISNHLLPLLLPRYDVRIEEYLMLTEEDHNLHRLRPDVSIAATENWMPGNSAGGVALAEPVVSELEYPEFEPLTQRRLRVIHRPTERLVTAIELLSPANKSPGEGGLGTYLEKRAELLACQCHLIELDLLRGGQRLPMSGPLPPGDYYAYIGRLGARPRCQVIGWPLRLALPTIPVPLLPEDPELPLELHTIFTDAYKPAFYDRRLPYGRPLDPPLSPADEVWVKQALPKR